MYNVNNYLDRGHVQLLLTKMTSKYDDGCQVMYGGNFNASMNKLNIGVFQINTPTKRS